MAVALLLPITYGLDVDPVVHHVRRHLLRRHVRRLDHLDPAQHPRRVRVGDDGHRGQQDGQAGPRPRRRWPPPRSARSSPAPSAPCWSRSSRPTLAEQAVKIGAPSYFAIMLLSLVLVTSVLGASKLRGFIGLFMGLTIGLVGLDLSTGQARLTGRPARARRRHRHRRRRGRRLRDRRGALDRRPPAPQAGRRDPGRAAVHGPRRLAALLGTLAARHRARLPVRRDAGGRRGDADLPVLRHSSASSPVAGRGQDEFGEGAIEGVAGPEAANNASAAGMFVPLLALGLPGHRDRRGPASPRMQHLRHPARPDADGRPARPGLDAAGQPAHRQHPAAGDQPAARPAVGQAAADPAAAALRRHPVLRLARRLQRQPGPVRPRPAAGLRRRRLRDPAVRDPGAAADPRRDPRTADGAQDARGARPVRRRHQRPVQRGPRDPRLRAHRAAILVAPIVARPAAHVSSECRSGEGGGRR